jgi:hypothetical protein
VPASAKPAVALVLANGLSGDAPQGSAALNVNSPAGRAVQKIVNESITEGTRAAAVAAALFVVLGAISSLFIPGTSVPAAEATEAERVAAGRRTTPRFGASKRVALTPEKEEPC